MNRIFYIILVFSLAFCRENNTNILVLYPYSNINTKFLDASDISTINTLFYSGLTKYINEMDQKFIACENSDCAMQELLKTENDQVIYTTVQKLGNKIILSGYILNQNNIFESRATAMTVEDMEQVCLRLAKSIALRETFEDAADVDNITQKEEEEPLRRKSISRVGVGLGYLFPFSNTGDDDLSQSIYMSFNYYYEFKNNSALLMEAGFGMPFMGYDLSFLKFTNNIDTSPFYGLGIGIHNSYNSVENSYNYDNSYNTTNNDDYNNSSGLSLNIQGGVMLYRTYDINVIAQAKYLLVTNQDLDNGFIINIKLQKNIKEKKNRTIYRYPLLELFFGN